MSRFTARRQGIFLIGTVGKLIIMNFNPLNWLRPGTLSNATDQSQILKGGMKVAAVMLVAAKGQGKIPDAVSQMANRTAVRRKTNELVEVLSASASPPAKVEDLIRPLVPFTPRAVVSLRTRQGRGLDLQG
jgi:hypothetical protein